MNQCFIFLKSGSHACMLVLYMLYQNMFLFCHSTFGISAKEQQGSVKIIWGSHRDGGHPGGATCQWAIISGVLVGRIGNVTTFEVHLYEICQIWPEILLFWFEKIIQLGENLLKRYRWLQCLCQNYAISYGIWALKNDPCGAHRQ